MKAPKKEQTPNLSPEPDTVANVTLDSTFSDPTAQNLLEQLYTEDEDDYHLELLTQYVPTSPPIQNTSVRRKSVFNPTFNKGLYIQTFYQVVYADILRLCKHNSSTPSSSSNLSPSELHKKIQLNHQNSGQR